MVLGFGVVWWSIATVLTPLAAKIGLPFLLVMRAFMGIGEVDICASLYYNSNCHYHQVECLYKHTSRNSPDNGSSRLGLMKCKQM